MTPRLPSFLVLALSSLISVSSSLAQDPYQLLRKSSNGYKPVLPGRIFTFPRDHYPHKDFKIEWWYLTANLTGENGGRYGVHWTLFRQAMNANSDPGGWQSNQTWMAHTAISTPQGFSFSERFARGGIGQAGVSDQTAKPGFEAWMDEWLWHSAKSSPFPATLSANTDKARFQLSLSADNNWILQGEGGFSLKSEKGQASYYYSQPFIDVQGLLWLEDSPIKVSGKGWLDREWSSQPLASDQAGWDWISLHLDNGSALMVYRLRHDSGAHHLSGCWINKEGEKLVLQSKEISLTPLEKTTIELSEGLKTLPLMWEISIPSLEIQLIAKAIRPNSWLDTTFPYWEGPVEVQGSQQGSGYLELTGY